MRATVDKFRYYATCHPESRHFTYFEDQLTLNATLFLLALEIDVNKAFLRSPFTFFGTMRLPGDKKILKKISNFLFQFFPHAGTVEENT